MGYVSVTGGQEAIAAAIGLSEQLRLQGGEPLLGVRQILTQMRFLVDRVMGEGGLYAPEYAALALKQAEGDVAEAAFLLRAYRTTLPRQHVTRTLNTSEMRVMRRISSAFKEIPGGQVLGPTRDYSHRLLDFSLRDEGPGKVGGRPAPLSDREAADEGAGTQWVCEGQDPEIGGDTVRVSDVLRAEGILSGDPDPSEPLDITRVKTSFPAPRSARLQFLARGETGALVALAYSSLRGYRAVHPTVGELRVGYVQVRIPHPFADEDSGRGDVHLGEILVTEAEAVNAHSLGRDEGAEPALSLGYGLCFGQNESKAIASAVLDRSLDTVGGAPAQDEEFVLAHTDGIESNGFVSHLKLPHYITFQSKLDRVRKAASDRAGGESKKRGETDGRGERTAAASGSKL